eukprot:COSAG02_NODE_54023_length_298_cov_0.954774_1_plen_63_part_10
MLATLARGLRIGAHLPLPLEEAEGGEAPAAAAAGLGVGALRAQTFNEAMLMRSGAVGGAGAAA